MLLLHLVLSTDDELSVAGMLLILLVMGSFIDAAVFSFEDGGVEGLKSRQGLAAATVVVVAAVELSGRWV